MSYTDSFLWYVLGLCLFIGFFVAVGWSWNAARKEAQERDVTRKVDRDFVPSMKVGGCYEIT